MTHRPDMPLVPGLDVRYGLGLWNSRLATFVVEGALWFGAVVLYTRATRPSGRGGLYGFWIMITILTVLWVTSLSGDPPPSLRALAILNTIFFLVLLAWAASMNWARPLRSSLRHEPQAI